MASDIVRIDAIVAGGDGLARGTDGRVVLIPRTAPGERVEVEYTEEHRQWARGRLLRIVEASPGRRTPSCPFYDRCGGCQLQHLEYETQLDAKALIVADSLRRLGGIEIELPEVVPSAREFEYRNRVTFILRRSGDHVRAGLHAAHKTGDIVDVDHCPLGEPPINRVWAGLRDVWGSGAERLPAGPELRLTLRGTSKGEVGLAVEGAQDYGEPETLLSKVGGLETIWSLDRLGAIEWYSGEPALAERWGPHELELAGDAFVQVNRDVAAKLETYVQERCGEVVRRRLIDAYCGFGLRALELAWKGARVVGIDANRHAIAVAQSAAAESGAAARFIAQRVERALARELPADLVLLNPPRRGVAGEVIEALKTRPPAQIVYVSCDPATLARDLKALGSLFKVAACRSFDMFPQTAHVETVVTLIR
ncbi:MAG: class I SAM-dependent RNA methyltransferase [Gemmatimonadota bacterium]|nr:MAG: class I SAM-dependent RNA methyltransferase [Gemmatimonadota bacterium]